MNCKNCGYPLFSNDKFCKNCGQEVVKESDISPVVNNEVNQVDNTVNNVNNNITNNESINNVMSIPEINNGPIAPVITEGNGMSLPNIDEKKPEPMEVNYNHIDGPKNVNNVMSMNQSNPPQMNEPIPDFTKAIEEKEKKEEEEKKDDGLANVNQALPTIPRDVKETKSSVIIPTKPTPINNTPVENNVVNNNQPMNNYNNNYNNGYNNNFNNNNYNNYNVNNNSMNVNNNNMNVNNNNVNNNQVNEVTPAKEKKGNPLLIILVLIILGVGGYFGYKYLIKGEKVEPTNTVSYEGYEFKVPKSLKTRINSNSLVAYDDTTLLSFLFINGSYDDFSSALVLENFNSLGNTAKYMGEKEKNGNKYHLYQVNVSGKETYIGYAKNGVTKIICFGVEPRTGSTLPSDDYLNKAVDITMSATYNGTSNMESNVVDEDSSVLQASQALVGEEKSTGDINGDIPEDVYEETYVNITLEEINE